MGVHSRTSWRKSSEFRRRDRKIALLACIAILCLASVSSGQNCNATIWNDAIWQQFNNIDLRVVHIYCLGNVPGSDWLNGLTLSNQVNLAGAQSSCNPVTSGTLWRVHVKDATKQIVNLECLGNLVGMGGIWLQGNSAANSIGLTAAQSDPGTDWVVQRAGATVNFQISGGTAYLNGMTVPATVGFAPSTANQYSGTNWQLWQA
jgi:hypothetical protein